MRKLLFIIFCTIIALLIVSFKSHIEKKDPIDNSFIIENLKMETDSAPIAEGSDSDGDIIFDDSFYKSISGDKTEKLKSAASGIYHEMKSKDSRWHIVNYKIKRNDTLSQIAKRYGISIDVILELNNITKNTPLKKGDILSIPSREGVFHKISRGDTLSKIAKNYSVDVESIAKHNNIEANNIIAGTEIFIPDGKKTEIVNKKSISEKRDSAIAKADRKKREEKNIASSSKIQPSNKLKLSWPLHGSITSSFGYRKHPLTGEKNFHCGLDIGADVGTPVYAAADGVVIFSGWKEAYGKLIVIQHKNNYITVYGHNSQLFVEENETVERGQKIALSGMTGGVTGPHLHFEIRRGIVPLNPLRFLK
jgi:murein DD-endopeptidase MepM/ murein hydrolase activator NlpD